jgi:hypothetical protein
MCPTSIQLESAIRSAVAEAQYRYFDKKNCIAGMDCAEDDAFLAFADQAVAEAEIRATEAQFALDEHAACCRFCQMANSN